MRKLAWGESTNFQVVNMGKGGNIVDAEPSWNLVEKEDDKTWREMKQRENQGMKNHQSDQHSLYYTTSRSFKFFLDFQFTAEKQLFWKNLKVSWLVSKP